MTMQSRIDKYPPTTFKEVQPTAPYAVAVRPPFWTQGQAVPTKNCQSATIRENKRRLPNADACDSIQAGRSMAWPLLPLRARGEGGGGGWPLVKAVCASRPAGVPAIVENNQPLTEKKNTDILAQTRDTKLTKRPRPPSHACHRDGAGRPCQILWVNWGSFCTKCALDLLLSLKPCAKMLGASLATEMAPAPWKKGVAIPLLKPEKPASDPTPLLPITLTSCIGKAMGCVIARCIRDKAGPAALPHQTGFRTSKPTLGPVTPAHTTAHRLKRAKADTTLTNYPRSFSLGESW
ncbi:reverse transcriptase (RNA-dependent DNA polymerase) [Trypanosoma grayi]|uniref:reverse transcriptase (RNA-dependent DNA polymerase) n=1 Tax=Trypanosoma grayi TaxID=71804 RepID=UPI0004F45F7F|nr:reverse transcriptase (RNA-dependent DNA polymerase) [Trypanosoma grayi]KEG08064.1 reverse transcriptase (RNA-dependent DNA polymerase) [Trypanosoma grayi]